MQNNGNPLYSALGGQQAQQNEPIADNFISFMKQMRGQNPQQIINQMVQSGQLTQQQLNVVQQRAREMTAFFDRFRNMFNF